MTCGNVDKTCVCEEMTEVGRSKGESYKASLVTNILGLDLVTSDNVPEPTATSGTDSLSVATTRTLELRTNNKETL